MSLNLPRIAELLALNRERTQGDWIYDGNHMVVKHIIGGDWMRCIVQSPAADCGRPPLEHTKRNLAFIAAAPELAEQLRLAVAEVERLKQEVGELQEQMDYRDSCAQDRDTLT